MVTYPEQLGTEAKTFWQHTGYDISSRFAAFWLENAPFIRENDGGADDGAGSETLPTEDARRAAVSLRQRIAGFYCTAPNNMGADDVYLYPTGMSAIAHTALALSSLVDHTSRQHRVAVFGYVIATSRDHGSAVFEGFAYRQMLSE